MTRLAEIIPINQEPNRLMGMEWMAPKPDPRLQLMTRPAFVDKYLSDVMSGRIAKQGLTRLANVLNQATSGQPEGLLDYVGPGAMGTPFFRAMTAFHGSPHKFDKFKLSKIGTGEGAQAYGHGLYFAESPGVAKNYQKFLTLNDVEIDGIKGNLLDDTILGGNIAKSTKSPYQIKQTWPNLTDDEARAVMSLARYDSVDEAIQGLSSRLEGQSAKGRKLIESKISALEGLRDRIEVSRAGHLYEVDIPDKYVQNFLDWDKPLSEQAESVQKALNPVVEYLKTKPLTNQAMNKIQSGSATGGDLYHYLAGELNIEHKAKSLTEGTQLASEALDIEGIKGIKYLDQASRGAGEGTRNLVVFDEDIIKMLKRE